MGQPSGSESQLTACGFRLLTIEAQHETRFPVGHGQPESGFFD
jgi:hypothetical protein